jgi:hypothetical protein
MIRKFIDKFMAHKDELEKEFKEKHPEKYKDIVQTVIKFIAGDNDYVVPDPERVHLIDDGDSRGILVFVIGAKGCQPDDYWYVKVGYGTCPACDTLELLKGCSSGPPTDEQVKGYMTLALHIVQGLKKMGGELV